MDDDSGMAHIVLRRLMTLDNENIEGPSKSMGNRRMMLEKHSSGNKAARAAVAAGNAPKKAVSEDRRVPWDEFEILEENDEDDMLWEFTVLDD